MRAVQKADEYFVPDAWGPGGVYNPGPVSMAAPGANTPLSVPGEGTTGILGCSSCTIGLLLLRFAPPAIRTTRKHPNNVSVAINKKIPTATLLFLLHV